MFLALKNWEDRTVLHEMRAGKIPAQSSSFDEMAQDLETFGSERSF
jgi:hypothetical protein